MFWLGLASEMLTSSALTPYLTQHAFSSTPVPIPSDPTEMQFRQMLCQSSKSPADSRNSTHSRRRDGFLKLFKMLENTSVRILVPQMGEPLCPTHKAYKLGSGLCGFSILVMSMYIMLTGKEIPLL